MGCPGYPWISLRFQCFRNKLHFVINPVTYSDILLNNSRLENRCTTSWISQGLKGDAATGVIQKLNMYNCWIATPMKFSNLLRVMASMKPTQAVTKLFQLDRWKVVTRYFQFYTIIQYEYPLRSASWCMGLASIKTFSLQDKIFNLLLTFSGILLMWAGAWFERAWTNTEMSFGFTWIQATEDGSIMSIQANDDREVGKETQPTKVFKFTWVQKSHLWIRIEVLLSLF